ncbi:hypothetical protein [Fusibacter bizertensis]
MNLNQFKSWKLLFEDEELCFSSAVNTIDQLNVFFITFFNPDKISKATKHLMDAHLHNFVSLIEEEGKLHLILKQQTGRGIKKFISRSNLDYDDRVQLVYEYLKLLEKYDAFNHAIKIQLFDEEQLLISDDGLSIRELIDYTLNNTFTDVEVFKQLGLTIDLMLSDAEGYHSQFIDNLILGHHQYSSIRMIKKDFKDIFIFEKPDALESINQEYNIILNDLEAGPPLPYTKIPHRDVSSIPSVADHDLQEDLHQELLELLTKESNKPVEDKKSTEPLAFDEAVVDDIVTDNAIVEKPATIDETLADEIVVEETVVTEASIHETAVDKAIFSEPILSESTVGEATVGKVAVAEINISTDVSNDSVADQKLKNDTFDVIDSSTVPESVPVAKSDAVLGSVVEEQAKYDSLSHHTATFKEMYKDELTLPESLPKSAKKRVMDDADLLDDDVFDLFDDAENEVPDRKPINSKWIIIPLCILLLALIIFFSTKILFSTDPIVASFDIEPLQDNRIAFMNKSSGAKNIQAYSWEIYYQDTLIQTFTDKNLFPVFDTEGTYTIILKVEDKKGNWSEPYSLDYFVETTEQVTTTP